MADDPNEEDAAPTLRESFEALTSAKKAFSELLPKTLPMPALGVDPEVIANAEAQMAAANRSIEESVETYRRITEARARAVVEREAREEGVLEAAQLTFKAVDAMRHIVAAAIDAAGAREKASIDRERRMIALTNTLVRATWVIAAAAVLTLVVTSLR